MLELDALLKHLNYIYVYIILYFVTQDAIKQFFASLKVLDINILKVKACVAKDKSHYMSVGSKFLPLKSEPAILYIIYTMLIVEIISKVHCKLQEQQ